MEEDILRGIQTVEYYYEQYKNGENEEETLIALEEIAKGIKRNAKARTKYYFLYKIFNLVEKFKVFLADASLFNDPDYQEIMGFCEEDIAYYTNIGKFLQEYVNYVLKTGDFDSIDNAFMLSIKMSMILHNITEYYKQINTLIDISTSSITYIGATGRVKQLKLDTTAEIEALKQTIEKKNS